MAEVTVVPVSWTSGVVNKYEAKVRFEEGKESRSIFGNPMPTEKEALKSLEEECQRWHERAKEGKMAIIEYMVENDIKDEPKKRGRKKAEKKEE